MLTRPARSFASIEEETAFARPSYSTRLFSPQFVKSIFNLHEVFYPMTWKKIGYWTVTGGAITGLVLLENYYGVLSNATNFQNMGFMSAVYAFEPIIQTYNMILASYPKATTTHLPLELSVAEDDKDVPEHRIEIGDDEEALPPVASIRHDVSVKNKADEFAFNKEMTAVLRQMKQLLGEVRTATANKHQARASNAPSSIDRFEAKYADAMPLAVPGSKKREADSPLALENFVDVDLNVMPPALESKQDATSMPVQLPEPLFTRSTANSDIAIMIACHNSTDLIAETVRSCLRQANSNAKCNTMMN